MCTVSKVKLLCTQQETPRIQLHGSHCMIVLITRTDLPEAWWGGSSKSLAAGQGRDGPGGK